MSSPEKPCSDGPLGIKPFWFSLRHVSKASKGTQSRSEALEPVQQFELRAVIKSDSFKEARMVINGGLILNFESYLRQFLIACVIVNKNEELLYTLCGVFV